MMPLLLFSYADTAFQLFPHFLSQDIGLSYPSRIPPGKGKMGKRAGFSKNGKIRIYRNAPHNCEVRLPVAERMRLERTMPCGTPHFQCGSLPLEYLSVWRQIIITDVSEKIKREMKKFFLFFVRPFFPSFFQGTPAPRAAFPFGFVLNPCKIHRNSRKKQRL